MKDNCICVFDLCGNVYQFAKYADYYPDKGVTIFGGEWEDVPALLSDHAPTESEIYAWVNLSGFIPFSRSIAQP